MLDKTYDPADLEARIHAAWERADAFRCGRPERLHARPFTIVIPPPNVTGSLHMGHALNNTLQDVLCRFERMRGADVLWQPGMDHAGIATQMVVERELMERQQPDRLSLGREAFVEKVWAWKADSGGAIVNQLKRLGASCDWSRARFTMDEGLTQAVLKVFVELYQSGLIYKDKRLVNWDPRFQSAISDLEVEQHEHKGAFKWALSDKAKDGRPATLNLDALGRQLGRDPNGHMYYFRYPLADASYDPENAATYLTVATTRPETMLGDTAVAVHPDHPTLATLIGRALTLPLTGRTIPVIGDDYADPEKGTGAVKITPAHDFNDFEVGKRHADQLAAPINIFDAFARINDNAPAAYRGLDRFEARIRIVADLNAQGLVERIEPQAHAVPHGDRSGVPVEPWLTDQWYVDAAALAGPAMTAVREGQTRFVPERFAADYFRWLEHIQPWCISRQLWWGHRIPAWYGPDGEIFVALSEAEAMAAAKAHYGDQPFSLDRDPDVLDTWFSSALWPFSTLGWPEQTPELARHYPTTTLVTGFDIIFFWVARMMMMGCHFLQEVPFKDVYIHGLVRDEKGQKMSKTKGNVVDPLDLIEHYGADAVRFAMASMASQGADVKFSRQRVEGYRNFATKLWNAVRFAQLNGCERDATFDPGLAQHTINRWIIGETQRTSKAVTSAIESYRFNEAAFAIYDFIWARFCDWYLELTKPILAVAEPGIQQETRACTAWVLDQALALLHPFMPFITEELWAKTAGQQARTQMLVLSQWPDLDGLANAEADQEIGALIELINEVRSVRAEMNVPGGAKVPLLVIGADPHVRLRVDHHMDTIKRLARLETVDFAAVPPKGSAVIVAGDTTAALPLADVIDMAAERHRLQKAIGNHQGDMAKMDAKLDNPNFLARAKQEAIDEARERKAELEGLIAKLEAALARIET